MGWAGWEGQVRGRIRMRSTDRPAVDAGTTILGFTWGHFRAGANPTAAPLSGEFRTMSAVDRGARQAQPRAIPSAIRPSLHTWLYRIASDRLPE